MPSHSTNWIYPFLPKTNRGLDWGGGALSIKKSLSRFRELQKLASQWYIWGRMGEEWVKSGPEKKMETSVATNFQSIFLFDLVPLIEWKERVFTLLWTKTAFHPSDSFLKWKRNEIPSINLPWIVSLAISRRWQVESQFYITLKEDLDGLMYRPSEFFTNIHIHEKGWSSTSASLRLGSRTS